MTPSVSTAESRRVGKLPTPRGFVLAASLAMVVMALAGCSSTAGDSDDTSVTSGPSTTTAPGSGATDKPSTGSDVAIPTGVADSLPRLAPVPVSAADAVVGARAAVVDYNNLWNEIRNDPDLDPLTIAVVASDQGASVVVAEMESLAAEGIVSRGAVQYAISTAAAGAASYRDGTVLDFGNVAVSGCLDVSGISSTATDGSATDVSDVTRYVWDYTVLYGAEQGSWFVIKSALPETPVIC
ncbi:MAG: hypothetical protein JWQ43_3066 [Glaciihabitans sp.]|nr:hypothetical protein [Glaciihabitans sp.]